MYHRNSSLTTNMDFQRKKCQKKENYHTAIHYLVTIHIMITAEYVSFRLDGKPNWESWNVETKSDYILVQKIFKGTKEVLGQSKWFHPSFHYHSIRNE